MDASKTTGHFTGLFTGTLFLSFKNAYWSFYWYTFLTETPLILIFTGLFSRSSPYLSEVGRGNVINIVIGPSFFLMQNMEDEIAGCPWLQGWDASPQCILQNQTNQSSLVRHLLNGTDIWHFPYWYRQQIWVRYLVRQTKIFQPATTLQSVCKTRQVELSCMLQMW